MYVCVYGVYVCVVMIRKEKHALPPVKLAALPFLRVGSVPLPSKNCLTTSPLYHRHHDHYRSLEGGWIFVPNL